MDVNLYNKAMVIILLCLYFFACYHLKKKEYEAMSLSYENHHLRKSLNAVYANDLKTAGYHEVEANKEREKRNAKSK